MEIKCIAAEFTDGRWGLKVIGFKVLLNKEVDGIHFMVGMCGIILTTVYAMKIL